MVSLAAGERLDPEAQAAWAAYLSMRETKRTYHEFLQTLNRKYGKDELPSEAEKQQSEALLKAHGKVVAEFNIAMQAVLDSNQRMLLIKKINKN